MENEKWFKNLKCIFDKYEKNKKIIDQFENNKSRIKPTEEQVNFNNNLEGAMQYLDKRQREILTKLFLKGYDKKLKDAEIELKWIF